MPGPSTFVFVDQARNDMKKLESVISTGMNICENLILDRVENDKDDAERHLDELKEIMLDYIKMEKELKQFLEAADSVKKTAKHAEEHLDLCELLNQKLEEFSAVDDRQLTEHSRYVDMENRVRELMTTEGSTSKTELMQIDDDMSMMQEMTTRCPYTGKEMHDPVRNIHCKHNYDREGINQAMKLRKGKTRCPVPGCINDKPISQSDLEDNNQLRHYIEKKNRQAERKNKKI